MKHNLPVLLLSLFTLVSTQSYSQGVVDDPDVVWDQMGALFRGADVETFDIRLRARIFRVFFNENWMNGIIELTDGTKSVKESPVKYDILNQQVNLLIGADAFVIPKEDIRRFYLFESSLKAGMQKFEFEVLTHHKKDNKVIYEIAENGPYKLLVYHEADVKAPDYIPQLDVGSLDEEIVRKEEFFLLDKTDSVIKIRKGSRSGEKMFRKYPEARNYLDGHEVDFKDRSSLESLVSAMNSNVIEEVSSK